MANTGKKDRQEPKFIHLHVHSSFSLSEGALPLDFLIELTVKEKQPAVAVTDRDNLFGALEFSEKAVQAGIQPIIGCTLQVDFEEEKDTALLVFLCANSTGYGNLMRLVSQAHLEGGKDGHPHISFAQVKEYNQGLIILSGGERGPLNTYLSNHQLNKAKDLVGTLKRIFADRFYIELQRHGVESEIIEDALIELAYDEAVPLVATNEVYFPKREDFEAHDALICIAEKRVLVETDRRKLSPEHYLKPSKEMIELFADIPEAMENSVEIARRCAFRVDRCEPMLPSFVGGGKDKEKEELRQQAEKGLKDRLENNPLAQDYSIKDYEERLDSELSIIEQMDYPGYFLIVADFVGWAKDNDIAVGPGRGSGAGSLVAWALTITDLDPMRFSLLFERFLNPERISMPDFDIDFCQDRRDEVIRYVQDKYGHNQVAQIITFGTLQARAVLRDVGRVLQMPYGQVDRLCKMVPNNPAHPTTLAEAVESEPGLKQARKEEAIVERLIAISLKLEGLYRHASTHAAGIVIGERALDQLVPLYRDARSDMPVTQFNMKWVENAGLVKFDFLGLKTLTVIRRTLEYLDKRNIKVDIDRLSLEDEKTFEMLQEGETVGIFQLESLGMRKALIGMKPDRFEDIIALVALYRPGPMDNIPMYNARKQGTEKAEYYHEKIIPILEETHGVIIYQEQVMQIAQILSGYSLGEADVLRRAMGKKIRKEMEEQRKRFVSGAMEREIREHQANEIFDVLAKFADYGFNKSHAAAYALISYQTAWLKAHYSIEFLAALMTLDMGNTDKLYDFYREGKRAKINVAPPCVNKSNVDFQVDGEIVHYALAAIKGVGAGVEHIIEVREDAGAFKSITDFFSRVEAKRLNRKMLENLIYAGAFDCFEYPREKLIGNLDRLIGHANRISENSRVGIEDMFGAEETDAQDMPMQEVEEWNGSQRLWHELQSLGFYLSAHPLDEYTQRLKTKRVLSWVEFQQKVRGGAEAGKLAGIVSNMRERKTRNGSRMALAELSDPTGQFEVVLFSQPLEKYRGIFREGEMIVVVVEADDRAEGVSLRVQSAKTVAEVVKDDMQKTEGGEQSVLQTNGQYTHEKYLRIFVRDATSLLHLSNLLEPKGSGKVSVIVMLEDGRREIQIDLDNNYILSPVIANAIKGMKGVVEVELA